MVKMVVYVHECAENNPLIDTKTYKKFHNRFDPKRLCKWYAIHKNKEVWFDIYFFSGA